MQLSTAGGLMFGKTCRGTFAVYPAKMPLLKLRLKEEQALASPELCRQAPKDDPRALLGAANFADLVGIVRQLGELSDYAAVVFHQLHAEASQVWGRGDALARRVKGLEERMTNAEACVLTPQAARQLLTNTGVEWRSTPQVDQNLFTRTELPPYVSEAYLDAQPPPPLHELDRFDQTPSDGVTLRRFSDPSFFKREWAYAELAEAEKKKKARKAKRRAKHLAEQRHLLELKNAAQAKEQSRTRRSFSFSRTPTNAPSLDDSPLFTPENPKATNRRRRYSIDIPRASDGDRSRSLTPRLSVGHSSFTPATQGTVSPYTESGVNTPTLAGETSVFTPGTQGTASPYLNSGVNTPQFKDSLSREHADVHRNFEHSVADLLSSVGGAESLTDRRTNGNLLTPGNRLEVGGREENAAVFGAAERVRPESRKLESADRKHKQGRMDNGGVAALKDELVELLRAHAVGAPAPESGRKDIPRAHLVEASPPDSARGNVPRAHIDGASTLDSAQEESPKAEFHEASAARKAGEENPQARRRSFKARGKLRSAESEPDFPRVESFDTVKQAARVQEQLRRESELRGESTKLDREGGDDDEIFLSADGRSSSMGQSSALDAARGASAPEGGEEEAVLRGEGSANGMQDLVPGSPDNQGLSKLQQEYQQAQARLEQLLRMQQELEEPHPPLEEPAEGGDGADSAGTSLVVEPSLALRGGAESEETHPPEESQTVDVESPPWSRTSSPLLETIPPKTNDTVAERPRQHSVLDSPGPSFAGLSRRPLKPDSSNSRFPPFKELFSSPDSSPEHPQSFAKPDSFREEPFSNGGVEVPMSSLPKPPPLPPPGTLAPPPPLAVAPPLRSGALASSRGGAENLMQAIAQHDRGQLKRVETQAPAPMPDRRQGILEQIKRGVNLRPTEAVKRDATSVRPFADSSVASILDRANPIRQAMQDSEDENGDNNSEVDWMD